LPTVLRTHQETERLSILQQPLRRAAFIAGQTT
jgi:hypothetical protein